MAADGDLKAHERTYGSFIAMFRYGGVAVAIIAVIVVLLIAR